MKGKQLFEMIMASLIVSVMLAIFAEIEEISLAIVTFLSVFCVFFISWKK